MEGPGRRESELGNAFLTEVTLQLRWMECWCSIEASNFPQWGYRRLRENCVQTAL